MCQRELGYLWFNSKVHTYNNKHRIPSELTTELNYKY